MGFFLSADGSNRLGFRQENKFKYLKNKGPEMK